MLTALVVAADAADRADAAALLASAGWDVQEADDTRDALRLARSAELDLVVADVDLPGGDGPALLRRLRMAGSRAHLVGTTHDRIAGAREAATAAGALAVLTAPVDPEMLVRFLLGRLTDAPHDELDASSEEAVTEDVDADLDGRLQDLYATALPGRLSAIDAGARAGDASALAAASTTLAGTSAQLGHPEVARLCRAIAADARRGVLAHDLVGRLVALAPA